jgi:uncharacterized protein (DUF2235 family)
MLDRTQGNTFHYYQPGIGTYVTSNSLDHTGLYARFKSWYDKAKDSAIGTAFGDHVMGGYRFLMRYYSPGDDIYFFGFSRGAYTARFLAEMLDHVGLLSSGNEELSRFAWKTFSKWQARRGGDKDKEAAMYKFMTDFRETFSRPVSAFRLGPCDSFVYSPRLLLVLIWALLPWYCSHPALRHRLPWKLYLSHAAAHVLTVYSADANMIL